jgi:hypothetical protein
VPATPTPDVKAEAGGEAELVAAVVREQLGYLNLDPAGVAAFARDFLDQFGEQERAHTLGRLASREAQEMQHAAAQFLMSSDFFRHDADMARVVRYIAYYRPQLGCLNPLARFD